MNVHALKCVVVLSSVLLLAACGTIEERSFSATQQGTKTQVRADRAGACLGLDRSVPPPATQPEAGQVLVGYENHLDRGADPFPCNHRTNYDHQAGVKFDVSALPADAILTEATLEADVHFIAQMPVTEISRDCQNRFQTATEAWADGNFSGPTTDPRSNITAEGNRTWTSTGGPLRIDVLTAVRNWVKGTQHNDGFVLSGPSAHSFAEENLSCVFALSNWNLHIKRFIPSSSSP